MTNDTGKEFLESYQRVRQEPRIFGSGNDDDVSDQDNSITLPYRWPGQQSDISVTSRSTRVDNYGLLSRPNYPESVSETPTRTSVDEDTGTTINMTGAKFERNEPVPSTEMLEADADELRPLIDQLYSKSIDAKGGSGEWLPVNELYNVMKPSSVLAELRQFFTESDSEEYVRYVCGSNENPRVGDRSSHRIFATLVLISRVAELPRFFKAQVQDHHLPFLWVDKKRVELYSKKLSRGQKTPLPCFHRNEVGLMRPFYSNQWKVLVPLFFRGAANEVKAYELHKNAVKPWTEYQVHDQQSGFSQVCHVEIHEKHHEFHEHKAFALKTLSEHNPIVAAEEFQRELKVFMKMKPDTHLLELLATFEVDFDGYIGYSFLFPWAEGGGLDNLWKRHPANLLSAQTREPGALLRWMAEQIHGLAAGLHSIHDLRVQAMKRAKLEDTKQERDEENYGIHGDIKPENILHFSQLGEPGSLGILKIADFGLTDFHTLGSRTFDVNRDTRFAAPTYSSPELAQPGGTFSRKADIWAVGCVLSQFITWAAHGPDAVKQFDKLRQEEKDYDHTAKTDKRIIMDTFFRVEYFSKGRVQTYTKRATKNWLQKMQRTLRTSGKDNFVTTMCDILLRKVLVAERVKRIGCNDLVVEFRQLAAVDERLNSQFWNPRLPAFRSPTT